MTAEGLFWGLVEKRTETTATGLIEALRERSELNCCIAFLSSEASRLNSSESTRLAPPALMDTGRLPQNGWDGGETGQYLPSSRPSRTGGVDVPDTIRIAHGPSPNRGRRQLDLSPIPAPFEAVSTLLSIQVLSASEALLGHFCSSPSSGEVPRGNELRACG